MNENFPNVEITYNKEDHSKSELLNLKENDYKGEFKGVLLKLYPKKYNKDHDIEH